MGLRSKNGRSIGETKFNSQYVRFGYGGEDDPKLKVSIFSRKEELKGKEYERKKKIFYYYLNQKGLLEELPRGVHGIEVRLSYDPREARAVPTHVHILGKSYSILELLESQVTSCEQRLQKGETGINVGFVSYPTIYDCMPYLEFQRRYLAHPKSGSIEEKLERIRKAREQTRKRFVFGRQIHDPDKI